MKYCSHCGTPVEDNAVVCLKCGCAVDDKAANANAVAKDDAPSAGFAVLGFFFPLVGLILYLVQRETHPQQAKSAGKGALIGFIVSFVLGFILGFAGTCAAAML